MLMDILMESLMSMDEDTLDYVLESCSDEEIDIIDSAMEEISKADADQLRSGYKLDTHNGVKGFINSFKNSGNDKWKNLAHDIKTNIVRIKNNLRGDGSTVSSRLGDRAADAANKRIDDKLVGHRRRVNDVDSLMGQTTDQDTRNKLAERHDKIEKNMANLNKMRDNAMNQARTNDTDFKHNNNSWSYKLGNYLQKFHK